MTRSSQGLLRKGAKSYLDALAAIEAFEKEAKHVCRDVYDDHRVRLVRKLGLKDAVCEDHHNKQNFELGVSQDTKSGSESFYVYLKWDETEDGALGIFACVSFEFSTRDDRDRAYKRLNKRPTISIQSYDDGDPELRSQRRLTELSSCAETLGEMVKAWLACWPADRRLK
jgi:hypothetical protein